LKKFRTALIEAKVKEGERFKIHDCRTLVLRDVNRTKGAEAAQQLGQHSSIKTTDKFYLDRIADRNIIRGLKIKKNSWKEDFIGRQIV